MLRITSIFHLIYRHSILDPVTTFFFSIPQPLCAKTFAFLFNVRFCRQSSQVRPVIAFLYILMLSKSTFTASFLDDDLLVENDVTKQGDYIEQYNVVVNVANNC